METENKICSSQKLQRANANLKNWILVLLIIPVIRTTVFQRRRDTDVYSSVDVSNMVDIVCVLLLLLICQNHQNKIMKYVFSTPVKWYVIYYILCAVSLLWAVRVEWLYTPYRAVEMIVTMLASVLFCRLLPNAREAYLKIMDIVSVLWIPKMFSIFLAVRSFTLEYYHTNTYTFFGVFAFLLALGAWRKKICSTRRAMFAFVSGTICLCIGTSSASYLSAIFGAVMLFSSTRKKIVWWYNIVLLGIGYWLIRNSEALMEFIFWGKSAENIATGTGRSDMWGYYIDAWRNAPFLGYGFPVGEKEAQLFGWVQTSSSHNCFLSVLINTGALGGVIFCSFLIATLLDLNKQIHAGNPYAAPVLAAVSSGIINSLTFPAIGSTYSSASMPFLLCIAFCAVWVFDTRG